jgi:hypothetical protein
MASPIDEFCELEDGFQNAVANLQGPATEDAIIVRKAIMIIAGCDDNGEAKVHMKGLARFLFAEDDADRATHPHFAATMTELYRLRFETES